MLRLCFQPLQKGQIAMMGYSHSVSAAAIWLALNESGLIHIQDTPTLIVTTLVAAGAGMLPDIDHHSGTIAHSIPPVSQWVARLVSSISGGHRKGTHSLLGLAVFWYLAYGANQLLYQGIPLLALALTGLAGGLALRVFKAPGGWLGAISLSVATLHLDALAYMPWAILAGATAHVLGDALSVRGINPFWPLTVKPAVASMLWRKSGYMALPLLGEAGSGRENLLTSILTLYIGGYALAELGILSTYPLEGARALLSM